MRRGMSRHGCVPRVSGNLSGGRGRRSVAAGPHCAQVFVSSCHGVHVELSSPEFVVSRFISFKSFPESWEHDPTERVVCG
jgi:hypothetical protein